MKREHEKIYQEMTEYYTRKSESVVTDLDLLQNAMVRVIETKKEFNDLDHFRNYLKSAVKTKRLDMKGKQQKENLVSLNDKETQTEIESYQVSIPRDYHLYKWIMTQKNSKDNYLFTTKQRKVLAKRYLSGKSNVEISKEMKVSSQAIDKIVKAIDRKLLSLPLKDMVGSWYHGSGFVSRSDVWEVYPDIKSSKIGYLKRYRRTNNPKDLDKFRNDSSRCLKAHIKRTQSPCYEPRDINFETLEPIPDSTPGFMLSKPDRITPKLQAHIIAKRLMTRETMSSLDSQGDITSTQLNRDHVLWSTHKPDMTPQVKVSQDGLWSIRSAVYGINQTTTA